MEYLFSPFSIRHLPLKNRIVMPALASFLVEADGSITANTVEHYRRRAAGGVAMVIVEAAAVTLEGIVSPHQLRIYDERFVEGISGLADAIKTSGARAAIQLHHAGRQTSSRVISTKALAPSPLPCPTINQEVKVLSVPEIQDLIRKFGEAAERAVRAGFELIEIHGAHGYLINQFLSAFSNIREDAYGGDLERRARFAIEVVKEIRTRIGGTFPLSFKISAKEFVPGGLDIQESIQIIQWLVEAGVDVVQVSAGNDATPEWISQPMLIQRGCLVDAAFEVKKAVSVPIMAVGRINGPRLAEEIIRDGKADLVCMGRALLADPNLPLKAKEGHIDEIRRCVACNTCMNSIFKKGRVECLVNPELGRENELRVIPAKRKKRVAVIGGGPGGAEAAWVAAMRGHQVSLYEKGSRIGGSLFLGTIPSHKKDLLSLLRFHEHQMDRYGVEVHLEKEITLDDIRILMPDTVVIAIGAKPLIPKVPGIGHGNVFTLDQALDGRVPIDSPGKRVVVVGGGNAGCEAAIHLSEKGYHVTLMEMLERVGSQYEAMTRKLVLREMKHHGIRIMTGCRLSRVEGHRVFYQGKLDHDDFIETDEVVLATGSLPNEALMKEIEELGIEVYRIGDCVEARSAKEAIYEGALVGRRI